MFARRNRAALAAAWACSLLLFVPSLAAQTAAQRVRPSRTAPPQTASGAATTMRAVVDPSGRVIMQPGVETPPAAEGDMAEEGVSSEEQLAQERLQKIQQLQFDRRPSAILQAWSSPEPERPIPTESHPEEEASEADAPESDAREPGGDLVRGPDAAAAEKDATDEESDATAPESGESSAEEDAGDAGEESAPDETGDDNADTTDDAEESATDPAETGATEDGSQSDGEAAGGTAADDTAPDDTGSDSDEAVNEDGEATGTATDEEEQESDGEEGGSDDSDGGAETEGTGSEDAESEGEATGGEESEGAENDGETGEAAAEEETPQPDPFDAELAWFQHQVTLGRWDHVKEFLAGLSEEEGKAAFNQLLNSFRSPTPTVPPELPPELAAQLMQMMAAASQTGMMEQHVFSVDDVVAMAHTAPHDLEPDHLVALGQIMTLALNQGHSDESLLARLDEETAEPEGEGALTRRQAALLLVHCGRAAQAGAFLPPLEQAIEDEDHEALNLLSRVYLALHAEDPRTEMLEQAWHVTQAVLAAEEITDEAKEEALRRAVDLAPQVGDELGNRWLADSFAERPQRGMEILAVIGTSAAQGLQYQPGNAGYRHKILQLQHTAAEALLEAAPERAAEWSSTLNLLAANWLREAEHSYRYDRSTRMGPQLRRDAFGNYFYYDENQMGPMPQMAQQVAAIKTADLLAIRPGEAWLECVDAGMRPEFAKIFAQLYLKVNEEDLAFPFIEGLAQSHPEQAEELVSEFLRVWTRNHDPNASRNRTNPYMFMYGFDRRAEGIPLTRSKQERNLRELAELVTRLRALPLGDLDEQLLAQAFTTCHSSAEVYRLEAIESVFGSVEDLDPKTLAELAQQMRSNLVGVWRQPDVQQQSGTRRKQRDIEAEVMRGYEVARTVIEQGLERHPDHWALLLAQAALDHDENNYMQDIQRDSGFAERREAAFARFAEAARRYAEQAEEQEEDEDTTRVYELWYYASLGACDLPAVTSERLPDPRQIPRIREALEGLSDDVAARHLDQFANALFTRMSSVNPAVKFRYLKHGLDIVGDHKQALEAQKVFDYYQDLITEIRLQTEIDGNDVVGSEEPFGVFVNILHTREIERESGGFGRYLQNQNNGRYYYNYGRPTENYREKFEEIVRQALSEQFIIHSVTFQTEDVNSRAVDRYGWRVTPYAYLLVQARGPEVDKLPSLRLDLDFIDTSGYAIIPVESPDLPLVSSREPNEERPYDRLEITQTLDERQANEGKLILEVKATALGLVPDLEEILDVREDGFQIVEVQDDGVSVSRFDPDSDDNVVVSERGWMITMEAAEDAETLPSTFRFGRPLVDVEDAIFQRYADADLLSVASVIDLEERYGSRGSLWPWLAGAALVLGLGIAALVALRWRRPATERSTAFRVPDTITPFTLLGWLHDIRDRDGLDDASRRELDESIRRIETYFFATRNGAKEPDLHHIAEDWERRVRALQRV